MKTTALALLPLVAALSGCDNLPRATPDLGGLTFDFQKASDERFSIPKPGTPGEFVGTNEWKGGVCTIHHGKVKPDDPVRKRVRDGVRWSHADGVYHIENTPALRKLAGEVDGAPLAKNVSGEFKTFVTLPDSVGGDYRVSFRYQMRHALGEYGFYLVYFKQRDASGRWVPLKDPSSGQTYTAYPVPNGWGSWQVFQRDVKLPAGCGAFDLILRIDGIGELMFKDAGFSRVKVDTRPVTLILSPQGAFGDSFALSHNQPGGIGFSIRKNTDEKILPRDCRYVLDLPAGVDFVGASFCDPATVKTEPAAGGGTTTTFAPAKVDFQFSRQFATWHRQLALVRTSLSEGPAGTARLRFTRDGKDLGAPLEVKLFVIGEISAVKPKRYINGISTAGRSTCFDDAAADGAFAEFMSACGVDWVVCCNHTDAMVDGWHKAGIRIVTPTTSVANGYYLDNNWSARPVGDRYVQTKVPNGCGTTWDNYIDRSACPRSVIEERPFFLTNTVAKSMAVPLKGADGMWANWEPFMFKGRGCDCTNCLAVLDKWQKKTGGSRADFRSQQHGELVKVIDKHVIPMTGGDKSVGFIPGVSWRTMASTWRENKPLPEARPIDYAADFRWINPWGPYVCWKSDMPYLYQKRLPLNHFVTAKDIREQTDRDFPDAKRRPKLMSFPHGVQGLGWVTQPEHLEMALDSYFFNRWEASVVYFFPQGLDARYWRAFAAATTRAAKCERFVFDGKQADGSCALEPVAEYAAPSGFVTTYLPQYRDEPMLQHVAYDLDGARLVAAFNFWDKGEAFFTLRLKDLAAGDYVVTDEDGVLYRPGALRRTWSADDLRRGVMLMVGAARTKAFFVAPAASAPAAQSAFTADDMDRLYRSRKAALAEAAEEDRRYEAANKAPKFDSAAEI